MILIDSSVWIDHLRAESAEIVELLNTKIVLGHPFVTGEVLMGSLAERRTVMELFDRLPVARPTRFAEVRRLVEDRRLYGRGIGYVDVSLVAACLMNQARLLTRDRRLHAVAQELGVAA